MAFERFPADPPGTQRLMGYTADGEPVYGAYGVGFRATGEDALDLFDAVGSGWIRGLLAEHDPKQCDICQEADDE